MKNPKVSVGVLQTHFFLLLPSHQNHLSEQDRGNVCVLSLFGATNKSSGAPHSYGGHIKVYSHAVWAHVSAGTASDWIHPYVPRKKNDCESQKGEIVKLFTLRHMSSFSEELLLVLRFKSRCGNPVASGCRLMYLSFICRNVIFHWLMTVGTDHKSSSVSSRMLQLY